jgi:hypothetical protein
MVCDLSINLPQPARAQHIVDGLRKGHSTRTISRSIDKKNRVDVRRVIERIAADVNRYDTDVDEVAVRRAYEGDQAAWLALTHYERRACLDRLMERGLAGKGHVRWPELPAVEFGRSELGWLDYWCESVGEDQQRFRKMLNGRRAVRNAA